MSANPSRSPLTTAVSLPIDRKKRSDPINTQPPIIKHPPSPLFFHTCEVGAVDYCQRRSPQLTASVLNSNYYRLSEADPK